MTATWFVRLGTPLVVCGCAAAQPMNLLVNGGFESPAVGAPWVQRAPGYVFPAGGWTVDNVNQGIVHVASFGRPSAFEGAQCVELNFFQSCGVSQTVATVPGRSYVLTYFMAGQNDVGSDVKHMRVDWNGAPHQTVTWTRSTAAGWEYHSTVVTATASSTVLHFYGLEEVDGGPYLDDVRLVAVCGRADVGSSGGVQGPDGTLDNNDFVVFIDLFFEADPRADFGRQGGVPPADGLFDNNDFVVYIDAFFNGCD